MGRFAIFLCLCWGAVLLTRSASAAGRGPGLYTVPAALDSLPAPARSAEKPNEKPGDIKPPDIIKEVPKSRRKIKPIAVPAPLPVKPIKIIKPKIIRTVGLIG